MTGAAWPRVKRRANFKAIEQELYTYNITKKEIDRMMAEIDEMASSLRSSWPQIGFIMKGEEKVVAPIQGRSEGRIPDPTADMAQDIWQYRERVLGSLEFREMVRRVEAIDYMLTLLKESRDPDAPAKLRLVEEKYFKRRLTDQGIWEELHISKATFYRWRYEIIQIIAQRLGWVV